MLTAQELTLLVLKSSRLKTSFLRVSSFFWLLVSKSGSRACPPASRGEVAQARGVCLGDRRLPRQAGVASQARPPLMGQERQVLWASQSRALLHLSGHVRLACRVRADSAAPRLSAPAGTAPAHP